MLCSACGTRNPEGQTACGSCGRQLGSWAPTYVGPLPKNDDPNLAPAAAPPPDASLAGQTIAGRYVIQSQLGRGGVGVVYRAKDTVLGEDIAVKLLQSTGGKDPREVERFKREILVARRISHPNVIRIHDFGTMSSGEAFISMELLLGGTLSKRIEQGVLPVPEAVEIAVGICDGLAAAHAEGIVHRDIKPDNVLFDKQGRPKVVDFGLARLANSTTRTVGFSGTPFYMSPEQADGSEATAQSDVYSLGVMFFELFTGRLPFVAESLVRLVVLHTKEKPPVPRSIRPDLPASIDALLLRMLDKDPARRPASAAEVGESLRNWKKAPTRTPVSDATVIRAAPATELPRDTPPRGTAAAPKRRRWAPFALGSAAFGLAIGGYVIYTGLTQSTSPEPTPLAVATKAPAFLPSATPAIASPTQVAIATLPAATPTARTASTPRPTLAPRPTPTPTPRPSPVPVVASAGPSVLVTGDIWASVSIDASPLETAPFTKPHPVPTGMHSFRFENKNVKLDETVAVMIVPNASLQFKIVKGATSYSIMRVK